MKNTVEIDTLFVCVAWKLSFKKQTFESNRRKYSAQLIFIAILHACESNRNASSFIFFIIFYCFNCDRRQSAGTEEHVREWYTNQIANEWVTVNAICSTLPAAAAAAPKTYRSQSLAQYTKDPMNVVCASSILAVLFAHAFAFRCSMRLPLICITLYAREMENCSHHMIRNEIEYRMFRWLLLAVRIRLTIWKLQFLHTAFYTYYYHLIIIPFVIIIIIITRGSDGDSS